jgi:hypothetical protein
MNSSVYILTPEHGQLVLPGYVQDPLAAQAPMPRCVKLGFRMLARCAGLFMKDWLICVTLPASE